MKVVENQTLVLHEESKTESGNENKSVAIHKELNIKMVFAHYMLDELILCVIQLGVAFGNKWIELLKQYT